MGERPTIASQARRNTAVGSASGGRATSAHTSAIGSSTAPATPVATLRETVRWYGSELPEKPDSPGTVGAGMTGVGVPSDGKTIAASPPIISRVTGEVTRNGEVETKTASATTAATGAEAGSSRRHPRAAEPSTLASQIGTPSTTPGYLQAVATPSPSPAATPRRRLAPRSSARQAPSVTTMPSDSATSGFIECASRACRKSTASSTPATSPAAAPKPARATAMDAATAAVPQAAVSIRQSSRMRSGCAFSTSTYDARGHSPTTAPARSASSAHAQFR